ncbi:MAG: GNAT family N-acetyltransferase [Acidobacteriia bacterium]|nr:GNAT family N-acetyltransferase [Terriglobia bacterium]
MKIEITSPFPFEALPRIWRWIEPFRHKVLDDFGPQDLGQFVEWMAMKWDQQMTWAVYGDGELGGLLTFERLSPWLGTAHAIFKPDFQGKGITLSAVRETGLAIFDKMPELGKVEFYVPEGNLAMGSLLVNLGAKREAKLAAHTLCGGKPVDLWIYGIRKEEFYARNIDGKQPIQQLRQHHPPGPAVHVSDRGQSGADHLPDDARRQQPHHSGNEDQRGQPGEPGLRGDATDDRLAVVGPSSPCQNPDFRPERDLSGFQRRVPERSGVSGGVS